MQQNVTSLPGGGTYGSDGSYTDSQGNTYSQNSYNVGAKSAGTGADQYHTDWTMTPKATNPPATLVTSSQSRSTYNNNVNNMNTALTNLKQTNANNPSVVDALNLNGLPSDLNSRAKMAVNMGLAKTTQEYIDSANKGTNGDINLKMLGNMRGVGATDKPITDNKGDNPGAQTTGPTVLKGDYNAGDFTAPDGSDFSIDANGNITKGDGQYAVGHNISEYPDIAGQIPKNNTSGIDTSKLDPGIAKAYNDIIKQADDIMVQKRLDLDAAKATVSDDPAATAALDSIKNKYDVLIKAMKDKNDMLIGGYNVSNARSGGMQYTPEMTSNFMSVEMDNANGRITDLINQEQDLLLKTTIAYKNDDIKAFKAGQTAYDKANTDKLKAINDLAKATNNAVKLSQAQSKIDAQALKDGIANNNKVSLGIAGSAVDQITNSGLSGKDLETFIQETATANGISNPAILQTAIDTEQTKRKKGDLANKNVQSTINNRGKSSTVKADPNAAKFNTVETNAMYGAGVNSSDLKVIKDNITKYGAQAVIDNASIPDNIKTILESKYGMTRTATSTTQ